MTVFPEVKGRNKIFLIFPKLDPGESIEKGPAWEPISVVTLAGHLVNRGFSVEIYDSRIRKDFEDALARDIDDVLFVGISTMAGYQVVEGYNFTRHVKKKFPHIPVIWGGWFPTVLTDQCLESPYIDIVVKGQGEELLPEIAEKIKTLTPVENTEGISCKKNGKIIHNPMRPLADINGFLPVDYGLLDSSSYTISQGVIHYISSVGCPYTCTFCGVSTYLKRKWYGLEPERVVQEIKSLYEKFRFEELIFYDSTFFVNVKRSKAILKGILREGLKFKWLANSYVNQVINFDDELLELLRATNCGYIELGIESGSKRMRELFNKNFRDRDIAKAVNILSKSGITVRGNYIIAPPQEEKQDFMATVRSMIDVKEASRNNMVIMYQYTSIPGTGLARYEMKGETETLPKHIDDWSTYYHKLSKGLNAPWRAKKDSFGRQPILFYFKLAYKDTQVRGKIKSILLRLLKKTAAFRLKHEMFALPVEWYIYRKMIAEN